MKILTAVFLAALAGPDFAVERGKYLDVVGRDRKMVKAYAAQSAPVAERFIELFGEFPGKKAAVVLLDMTGQGAPEKVWKKHGAKWEIPWIAVELDEDNDFWARELAKSLLAKHVDDRAAKSLKRKHKDYGSYLPDWLDEGVMGLHGNDDGRKRNREDAKTLVAAKKAIPFSKLFTMNVPGADLAPGVHVFGPLEPTDPEAAFGIESLSVCEFVLERYGVEGIRLVVEIALKDKSLKHALPGLTKLRKTPADEGEKPPKTLADLQKAWETWVAGK